MKLATAKFFDSIYRGWMWAYERDYELALIPLLVGSVGLIGFIISTTGQVLMAFVWWALTLLAIALLIGVIVGIGKAIKWGNRTMNDIRNEDREWKRAR